MKKDELLEEIQEALQRDDELSLDMRLEDLDEWDSLAIISLIALYDDLFSVLLKNEHLLKCESVGDLVNLVKDKIDG